MSDPTSGRMSDGGEDRLPFPEPLPSEAENAESGFQRGPAPRGMAGGEVCLLDKPPTSVSYVPRGSGLDSPCFEERDHTESPAVRRGTLLIVCVCSGVWLPLGRSHPCTLSKVDCKNTAQASAARASGLFAATRAVNCSINSRGITFLFLSGRCA